MGGPAYDFLANPLGAIRLSFEKAVGGSPSVLEDGGKDWGALDLFRQFLGSDVSQKVPIVNSETIRFLQPNTLVRYRGMIQDMLGNEFYVGAFKDVSSSSSWRTNKFADVSQQPMCSSSPADTCIWERRLLYCVPVPGQNAWAEDPTPQDICSSSSQNQLKRRRIEDDDHVQHMEMITDDDESEISQSAKKMKEEGHSSTASAAHGNLLQSSSTSLDDVHKDYLPCLVKIYDTPESELKLNDVFEFIGVLTFGSEPTPETEMNDCDEISNGISDDDALHHLPPNKVPRLHCLIHRKLAVHDFLHTCPILEPKSHIVKEIRQTLLRHLSTLLGNDELAAHFVLLHLLSRVHTRVDDVAVGKLSLNLTGLNTESVSIFGTRLSSFIESLLPFTHYLPLTLDYLNSASLAPKKDYQINRLKPGILQMAEGSHLMIDETQLKAGTLNAVGVGNTRSLKYLTEFQKVEYDFEYYRMEMAADIQLLVLSDGKSNIVPADVVLPLRPCSVDVSSCGVVAAAAETLGAWRWYLATIRSSPHSMEADMVKVVEDDLVAARQADRSLGSQEFSGWLTMGRLMCLSFGETVLTREHWQMVMELERLRRERLN